MVKFLSGKHYGLAQERQSSSRIVRGNGTELEDSKGLAEETHKGCAVTGRNRMVGGVGLRVVATVLLVALGGLTQTVAHAAYKTAPMSVSATILSHCSVTSSQSISATSSIRAADAVQVQCSALTAYRITAETPSGLVVRSAVRTVGAAAGSLPVGAVRTVAAGDAGGTLADGDSVVTVEY